MNHLHQTNTENSLIALVLFKFRLLVLLGVKVRGTNASRQVLKNAQSLHRRHHVTVIVSDIRKWQSPHNRMDCHYLY